MPTTVHTGIIDARSQLRLIVMASLLTLALLLWQFGHIPGVVNSATLLTIASLAGALYQLVAALRAIVPAAIAAMTLRLHELREIFADPARTH